MRHPDQAVAARSNRSRGGAPESWAPEDGPIWCITLHGLQRLSASFDRKLSRGGEPQKTC
eukprot:886670-Prorocentrum_lima.AAC.1